MSSPAPYPVTIQLNSVEAIERLIGGNSEIEIGIRNNVIQKFAEKHLKPLMNDSVGKEAYQRARTGIEALIADKLDHAIGTLKQNGYRTCFTPSAEFKGHVLNHTETYINEFVEAAVKTSMNKFTEDVIEARINQLVESGIAEIVRTKVQAKLAQVAKAL